jgi:hypothetical protein
MRRLLFLLVLCALGVVPARAEAFCGFYVSGADAKLFNNASVVVLMRDGTRTVLAMQNNYQGPPSDFAMVVPVPIVLQKENVKTLPRDVFERIDQLTAPRLVEYWERDPCAPPEPPEEPMAYAAAAEGEEEDSSYRVKVEAKFSVGEYDIVVLSAEDSGGLDRWLRDNHYAIPKDAEPVLRPYVTQGSKFFVAKVNVSKVKFEKGQAMLSPLRVHYDAHDLRLPVRLGLLNAKDAQDLIVMVLSRGHRFEVTNYTNVTIPTNLAVAESARDRFPQFYAALFDRVLEKNPRAVVTEYAWDAGSCDPCPIPPLSEEDVMTLGGDVAPSVAEQGPSGFVLTRLHARYTKDTLGDDLVFREASPIVGGREMWTTPGQLEQGARPDSYNNFQGRYIIRHPWPGAIECAEPHRGIWQGPPDGKQATIARDLAFVLRNEVSLEDFVKEDVASGGVVLAKAQPTPPPPPPIEPAGGCAACAVGHARGGWAASAAAFLGLGLAWLRRRRRG